MNELEEIRSKIYNIRGMQIMLDKDLAELYGVEVRALNQAVRRNIERFPDDFMFQLNKEEWEVLRSQIVTLKNGRGEHSKYLPYDKPALKAHSFSGGMKTQTDASRYDFWLEL